MARPLRLQFPGAIYHVTARGNARQRIYRDDDDRQQFLAVLGEVVARYRWRCHAYCLMNNHYHVLVETAEGNLSVGMRQLNGVYTQRFNRRHRRVGYVFQGRFKAILLERESYLLELCRYVVLNPVRAHVVKQPEAYRWSSYRATVGMEPAPEWLMRDWVLAQFSPRSAVAGRKYQQFVYDGLHRASPWAEVQGQVVLGQAEFVNALRPLLAGQAQQCEIPRRQRAVHRPSLEAFLRTRGAETREERDQRIWQAHREYGNSLTAIGQQLGRQSQRSRGHGELSIRCARTPHEQDRQRGDNRLSL
jgi:REP element-mobilizing transposase RayT